MHARRDSPPDGRPDGSDRMASDYLESATGCRAEAPGFPIADRGERLAVPPTGDRRPGATGQGGDLRVVEPLKPASGPRARCAKDVSGPTRAAGSSTP